MRIQSHFRIKALLAFFSLSITLFGQTDSITSKLSTLETMKPFIDSLALEGMEKYHIPGAVIAIVVDSSEVFLNGYGYADLEAQKTVDPNTSLFRIASITKTFTATAVMQLVQEGKLDLHQDVRKYLPDDNFDFLSDTPITLHHLLTHTAGFDLTDTGDAALVTEKIIPLEEMARRHMPDRIYKPGDVHSYSNFGYALIGYIIQEVSGMTFEDYIRTEILQPINMVHSGIKQPLPEPYKSNLSKSYIWKDKQIPLARDYTNTLPGGGIISSGQDMANYMLMHLNGGQYNGTEILGPEFHKLLTSQQYGSRNTRYGICYSFFENRWTGRRSIEHSGGQLGFVSLMILIPEIGAGIFITHNNRKDSGAYRYDMTKAILDTLVGFKKNNFDSIVSPKKFDEIAKNYTGVYKQMNYPKNTFEKLVRLFGMFSTEYKIEYDGAGSLTTYGDSFVHVGDHLFRLNKANSDYTIEFIPDETGKAQRLMIGASSYERISWFQKKRVQQGLFLPSLFLLLLFIIIKPLVRIIRKTRKRKFTPSPNSKGLRNWLYKTALLIVLGALGLTIHFLIFEDQVSDYGVPFTLKASLLICTVGFILAFLSPYYIWKNWSIKGLSRGIRTVNTLIILAVILVSIMLYSYNLIGFQYY